MKPNKPGCFDGTRDALSVRTWLYSVEKYLRLIQVGQTTELSDEVAIDFASTFLVGTAANWWFSLVQGNRVPATWEAFKVVLETEFVPQDSINRARDRLYKLKQRRSVAIYLIEFRNAVLEIPDMSEGEKLARFSEGLKPHILLEVRKENPRTLDAAANIALNVDGAYYGAGLFSGNGRPPSFNSNYAPMEIGNFERRRPMNAQKLKDIKENLCFVCRKSGCRASNHKSDDRKRKVRSNNTHVSRRTQNSSDEEN